MVSFHHHTLRRVTTAVLLRFHHYLPQTIPVAMHEVIQMKQFIRSLLEKHFANQPFVALLLNPAASTDSFGNSAKEPRTAETLGGFAFGQVLGVGLQRLRTCQYEVIYFVHIGSGYVMLTMALAIYKT